MAKNGFQIRTNIQAGDVCYNSVFIGIKKDYFGFEYYPDGCYRVCYEDWDSLQWIAKSITKVPESACYGG